MCVSRKVTCVSHSGSEEAASIENAELVGLRKELATRKEHLQLDGFGYYL